jgi:hypothetical protein
MRGGVPIGDSIIDDDDSIPHSSSYEQVSFTKKNRDKYPRDEGSMSYKHYRRSREESSFNRSRHRTRSTDSSTMVIRKKKKNKNYSSDSEAADRYNARSI